MHEGEVAIDAALVERLVAAQHPSLLAPPVREVRSTGTVNAIYRLGEDLYVRLPRVEHWARDLEKELAWLPRLAPHVSLRVPEPVAAGKPADGFPFPWAIYRWIDGEPYAAVEDELAAALALAGFVRELRAIPVEGAPCAGRAPLRDLDAITRAALVDPAPLEAWERALAAPAWDGERVWIHADLLRPNLLVRDGRLRAVIDFGSAGAGDPAFDLIPAWAVFTRPGRDAFRAALDVDDGTWERARGYALHQAALIIPYYAQSNPAFVALARSTVAQVLEPLAGSPPRRGRRARARTACADRGRSR